MQAGYLLMGALDLLTVLILSLKMYRLPILIHKHKILFFIVTTSFCSYLMRVVIDLPGFDMPVQYLLMVMFLVGCIQIRMDHAAFVAASGTSAFILIQMFVLHVFIWSGVLDNSVLTSDTGMHVYLIQASTQLIVLIIAYCLYLFKYGFTFISVIKVFDDVRKPIDKSMLATILLTCVTIIVALRMLYTATTFAVVVMAAVSFGASYYLSKKRGHDDFRKSVETYRGSNQA